MHVKCLQQGLAQSPHPLMLITTVFLPLWSQTLLAANPTDTLNFLFLWLSSQERLKSEMKFPILLGVRGGHVTHFGPVRWKWNLLGGFW